MFFIKQINIGLPRHYNSSIHFTDIYALDENPQITKYGVKKVTMETDKSLHYTLYVKKDSSEQEYKTKKGKDNIFSVFLTFFK